MLLLVAGALPAVALLASYHAICFGSAFKTGYSYSFDTSTMQGFMGIVGPSKVAIFSTLLLPANGLLVLVPWVVLGVVGRWPSFAARSPRPRRRRGCRGGGDLRQLPVRISSLTPYMARGGWCVGPR